VLLARPVVAVLSQTQLPPLFVMLHPVGGQDSKPSNNKGSGGGVDVGVGVWVGGEVGVGVLVGVAVGVRVSVGPGVKVGVLVGNGVKPPW